MTIPTHHNLGDTGHTTDHNAIADVLTGHDSDIDALQAAVSGLPGTYQSKAGENTVTLTNPTGVSEIVVIPSGSRDAAALVHKVTYGGRTAFSLDTYGQVRANSAMDTSVPVEIAGPSGQTGNLTNWRKDGTIVARVDSDGNVYAPNLTPVAWASLSLAATIAINTPTGTQPQYRRVGDVVELRGNLRKTSGDFTASPIILGTLPAGFRPQTTMYFVQPAEFETDFFSVRMEINDAGAITMFFRSSAYTPAWVSLDGIRFSQS